MAINYKIYPKKLNLGCGFDKKEGYFNIDINKFHDPDFVADVSNLSMLPSNYYEEIIAIDVLEHIERYKIKITLCEWNRLLKEGGILQIRVPDLIGLFSLLCKPENQTIEKQEELIQCCFGTQAYQGDFHYFGFTTFLLKYYLEITGFCLITISIRDQWLIDAIAKKINKLNKESLLEIIDAKDFIREAYWAILQREPDKEGFNYYLNQMEKNNYSKISVINSLSNSEERKKFSIRGKNNERKFNL